MVLELVKDLVHLKGGEDRLDQDRRLDRATRDAKLGLSKNEHIVPKPRFQVTFHFGKVEVGTCAPSDQLPSVVKEIKPEVKERSRYGLAANEEVFLQKVPAPGPDHESGRLLVQCVSLSLGVFERDLSSNRIQ